MSECVCVRELPVSVSSSTHTDEDTHTWQQYEEQQPQMFPAALRVCERFTHDELI